MAAQPPHEGPAPLGEGDFVPFSPLRGHDIAPELTITRGLLDRMADLHEANVSPTVALLAVAHVVKQLEERFIALEKRS